MTFTEEQDLGIRGAHTLMQRRVREILLVSSLYDSFVLEEDGQLGDRLLADYEDLHEAYAPRLTRVSTAKSALTMLRLQRFDLVLTRMRLPDMEILEFSRVVRQRHGSLPIVILAHENAGLSRILEEADPSVIDHVLVWSGDSRLLLATIKLIEDRWNVDHDTREGMVRTILVVEDSARRLSSFLPMIYTELVTQTRTVMAEGLNHLDRLLRMQARPKILLARDYEEAEALFERFEPYMLAVISDVRFPHGEKMDPEAGLLLLREIRARRPVLPVVVHSSDPGNRGKAVELGGYFLDKNSPVWLQELHEFFISWLGFGDFVFRLPDGTEVDRARNLREMERKIHTAPDESLTHHLSQHHLSMWLRARGEHALAEKLRTILLSEFENLQEARDFCAATLRQLRAEHRRGTITDFNRFEFDPAAPFVRLGRGSLGGKGRGIAFLVALLDKIELRERFPAIRISVPQAAAIGTDSFTRFLEENDLGRLAVRCEDDAEIARAFLAGGLPPELVEDLRFFLGEVHYPLAVRSSSLAEDSLFQPFAGLYATYMLPNNHPDLDVRLRQLTDAIKLVYASTFAQAPKAYIRSTPFRMEEEKMAVIVQRLVATRHGDVCYPDFAGVAQSYNFYPVGRLRTGEGLAHVALGLGRIVVEGGNVLRFSPARPRELPQFANVRGMLKSSQKEFYALDLSDPGVGLAWGTEGPIVKLGLERAEADGTLAPLASVYDRADGVIRDGIYHEGPRLVTFAHVLKGDVFPLAGVLEELLALGRQVMAIDVELEFAVNLRPADHGPPEFALLQCRPLATGEEGRAASLEGLDRSRALCWTEQSLGSGKIEGIRDVVYVDPRTWTTSGTVEIAAEIGALNAALEKEGRRYVLIGLGRWGTEDRFLGIPVRWDEISFARVMVEGSTESFSVEPSQGTHFFHNITAFQIGYLTVQGKKGTAWIRWDVLAAMPAVREEKHVRHVRFDRPLTIHLDGRRGHGAIMLP
ncbi:MAG: PEP/pyruvate-binding domain-containing protein [Planctomycetota bacterium]